MRSVIYSNRRTQPGVRERTDEWRIATPKAVFRPQTVRPSASILWIGMFPSTPDLLPMWVRSGSCYQLVPSEHPAQYRCLQSESGGTRGFD